MMRKLVAMMLFVDGAQDDAENEIFRQDRDIQRTSIMIEMMVILMIMMNKLSKNIQIL